MVIKYFIGNLCYSSMKHQSPLGQKQLFSLVILRFFIGWHLLYEGFSKLMNPTWSSEGFLRSSQWIMSSFANWIVSNKEILSAVDFLNIAGLMIIGISLILGLFSRVAAVIGAILLLVYYLHAPPLAGLEYSEGDYLIINPTLIEVVALIVLAVFPTSQIIGLDLLINRKKVHKN